MKSSIASPPPQYGSTKQKNKKDKIGGRTIIDFHAALDILFVIFWLFSICGRPTIISTIHMLLFGIYVIIGGIILYDTDNNKSNLSVHQSPKSVKKKKKRYKVELADLSESLVSHTPPRSYMDKTYTTFNQNKQNEYDYHPPVRYGVDTFIMIMISTFCCIVAVLQVMIQILIAANVIDGDNDALKMFGFQQPQYHYDWALYLTLDLLLCIASICLTFIHYKRNNKYKWSRLNIINVEKILRSTAKSLPFPEIEHSHLSEIPSEDEDESDIDIEHSVNSISTQKTMLITAATSPKLPFFYQFIISCLLLIVSIAAPSVLHIPYFLVVLLVSLGPIIALWKTTKSLFNLIGPIYIILHLMLISIYQVSAIHDAFNDDIADILGLENLHQRYWSYSDLITNQHVVPSLVATIFAIILLYGLGLRPILLHASIYRSSTSSNQPSSMRQKSSSLQKRSVGNLLFSSPPQTRKRPKSAASLRWKSSTKPYHSLPDTQSDASHDIQSDDKDIKKFLPQKKKEENKMDDEILPIINEAATKIISDRRSTIMETIFWKLSVAEIQDDVKKEDDEKEEEEEEKEDKSKTYTRIQPLITSKSKKRAKTVNSLVIDRISTDSDTDSDDETMAKVERQETLKRLRWEQKTRKKLSMVSMKSVTSMQSAKTSTFIEDEDNIFVRKTKQCLEWMERVIEGIGQWFKWRFFLWGPLICQLVCLWSCFPHKDAFFIIIMIWSYSAIFLLSTIVQTRDVFKYGVISILIYSICAAFIKYISYIPSLYDSNSSEWFNYFGMRDYGDMNGSYMFVACIPFLITAGYLEIQKLYRLISCSKIVTYLNVNEKTGRERKKDVREMKKIAALYPQNFEAIMSKRGGTILHCCVDFRNCDMIAIVAPFVNVNARDMYGRTALSQARRIEKSSQDLGEKQLMQEIITALWRAGGLRNKQMRWYSKFWQYLQMTGNYLAAAFYVMIEKLILFGVYVISTERADILHLIFLIYFLIFIVLGPLAHKYWWTLVLYNGIAITIRYIFNVFDIVPNDIVAKEIGLRPPNDNTGLIYPAVLLSFVILHYHLTRKRKERHTLLEFKFEQLILKNTSRRTKSFLFAILYYLFYMIQDWCLLFVYIALIIIGMVQIHSIHLGYCVCVFFCFSFHCWFKDPWRKIRAWWILIVAYCSLCFFGLYASQYSFIHKWLSNDLYPKGFNNKWLSLEDIGLINEDTNTEEPFAMFMILLGPVIAMLLTIIQFSYFVDNKPHREVKNNYYVTKMSKICCQLLYLGSIHCEKLTLITTFIWCVYRVNLISMSYVIISCIALINRITLRTAWCPFQIIASIVFVLKYGYQFHYFEDHANTVNAVVIGFQRFGISIDNNPVDASTHKIWNGLGQELTIIILSTIQCILQWWIRLKPKYALIEDQKPVIVWKHQRVYYEDLMFINPRDKSYTFIGASPMELNIDESTDIENIENIEDIERESEPSKIGRSMSQAALLSALRYTRMTAKVIWRCFWRTMRRFCHVLTNIFYFYGVELSIILMVFAAFYRVYSFSVVFIFMAGCYIYDSRRNGEPEYKEWNILRRIWLFLWILLSLWLLIEFWIVIPYELEHIIGVCCNSEWWKIFHFNYNFETSQYRQWWSWMAFIDYQSTDLIFDFFVLLFVSLQRTNFIQHDKDENIRNGQKSSRSQLTLTKKMKTKSDDDENADILWESIKLQCLIYSDKVLLLLMFIFGIMNVDLLSIVFLLFPFFELFFSDSTNKQQLLYWWHYVQIYNYFVLSLFTLYQLPAIPAEKLDFPFIPWQNIVGVYKIYSNGDGYCHEEPCTNIFENSSIIHNIILLIIIDLQIKILISKSYENGVIATYREWLLFSKYRCFHSALMMKFKRLSQIDFFQNEKQIVQIQLEALFADKHLHESLAFSDEELTFYPRLEGELANKAQQEEELYKRNIEGQFSKKDPNLDTVNKYNKDDIDMETSDDDDDHDDDEKEEKEEIKEDEQEQQEQEEEEEEEEKLFVPYEEGLFMLIDKDFYVINTMAPKERHCKIMEFFDGGYELPWKRYLRHLYKNKKDEPFVAEFIVDRKEVTETDINEDGEEITKTYIKQYTETVAIIFKSPMNAIDFDTKIDIDQMPDVVACIVILPECSKFEAFKFKLGNKMSDFWIKLRMFLIAWVDTSMYCNAMDLMKEITKIREQLTKINTFIKEEENEDNILSGDLRAYYESQQQLLQNVPQPNQDQLEYYATLQYYYKDKREKKKRKKDKKDKKKKEKKSKKQVTFKSPKAAPSSSTTSTSSSISPKDVETTTTTTTDPQTLHESYWQRRRISELIHAKDTLHKQLSNIIGEKEEFEKEFKQQTDEEFECDNLLKMAVEIQSSTLDYLNDMNFLSLFGCLILSHTQELSILCFFVTLFSHATILYSIVPISFLIYGLLQLPRADQSFWLWIAAYTQIIMVLKFLYQLDIFCVAQYVDPGSQDTYFYYNIQPSYYCNNLNPGTIRFDQILGITKSNISNDAVSILIADIVCLIFVAIHIMMLKKKGVWYEIEHDYDNYIEIWFKEYEKRQMMYKELEKKPAKNMRFNNYGIKHEDISIIKRIGEPARIYDIKKNEFVENKDEYLSFEINQHRTEYVGIPTWDLLMYKFHALVRKFLPFEVRMYLFELIPPSFRLLARWESICDEVKPGIDLYFWMFIIDIILLIWVLLFYTNMAEPQTLATGESATSFNTSRFSGDMVFILFIQMLFMICDRIVYLTNTLVLKLICQFISVLVFHWLIFVTWILKTNQFFYDNGFLVTYYLLRLIYWLLSCIQIAYGYPTFIRSHSRMSKNFSFFYWIFFTVYMSIPFVYEMRTILEWVCIPTTLQLMELMKVEDIYGQLFKIKCNILMYKQQRNRGEQIPMLKKFFQGGCVFIAIIAFLIIPLLLFSTASPASTTNPVKSSSLSISINNIQGFGNLALFSLTNYKLSSVDNNNVPILLRPYFDSSSQISQTIQFENDADSIFTVPTVLRDRVSEILGCYGLNTTQQCEEQLIGTQIQMIYEYTRQGPDDNNPISGVVILNDRDLTPSQGYQLSQVLNSTNQNEVSFQCPTAYNKWLRLPAQNDIQIYNLADNPQQNVTLTLVTTLQFESYWNVEDELNFILISDNFVSSSLLSLTGVSSYSVIGFYAIVVYSFAQLLRLLYGDQVKEIIFQDLQNVDYILRIVVAVKLARNQRNYHLEEVLYRKLIRIYRDPALIVALSKRLKQSQTKYLAFDGVKDTSYNDPNSFGWGIRNRKHNILRKDDDDYVPPIQSNIKQQQ